MRWLVRIRLSCKGCIRAWSNQNVAALQGRGHVLVFQPSAAEVHAQAGEWFKDDEIYAWFGANLHRMREPSFRHYVRARELKAAGMNWKEVLKVEAENRRTAGGGDHAPGRCR